MGTPSVSLYLIRLSVLFGVAATFLIFGRRRGAKGRVVVAMIGGFLCLFGAEVADLLRQWKAGTLVDDAEAWESVYIYALGYVAIALGVVGWVRDLNASRTQLEADNSSLRQMAEFDFLTDLVNRRHAEGYIKREMARARRKRTPVGFVMMDLDHFKDINDTHGHQAGDAVLAHVGHLLRDRLRASDILVRYGGDEFLLVLPDSGLDSSAAIAETLRRTLQDQGAPYRKKVVPIQASFGVAAVGPGQNATVEELVARSDEALYAAKGLGRNRVTTWDEITAMHSGGDAAQASGRPDPEPVATGG
jgi:diguanylate cyclase (GGDEF)-like protein